MACGTPVAAAASEGILEYAMDGEVVIRDGRMVG